MYPDVFSEAFSYLLLELGGLTQSKHLNIAHQSPKRPLSWPLLLACNKLHNGLLGRPPENEIYASLCFRFLPKTCWKAPLVGSSLVSCLILVAFLSFRFHLALDISSDSCSFPQGLLKPNWPHLRRLALGHLYPGKKASESLPASRSPSDPVLFIRSLCGSMVISPSSPCFRCLQ